MRSDEDWDGKGRKGRETWVLDQARGRREGRIREFAGREKRERGEEVHQFEFV